MRSTLRRSRPPGWSTSGAGDGTTTATGPETATEPIDPRAILGRGDLLVVDEAGMLDQDTARALLEIAHECGARVAFMGDRHQLPAVGRGGVLDLAAQHAGADGTVSPRRRAPVRRPGVRRRSVWRCAAVEPSATSEQESVFDALWRRGQIRLHASEPERTHALAREAAEAILAGHTSRALMADSREQVAALNGAIRDRLVAEGFVDDDRVIVNESGERLGVGRPSRNPPQRLAARSRQPADAGPITGIGDDEHLTLRNDRGQTREVPVLVRARLGRARLRHHRLRRPRRDHRPSVTSSMGETTSAASAYVGMTRGRHDNVAHLVADDPEQARAIWEQALGRDRADLGVAHARLQAIDDIDRYGPNGPAKVRTHAADQTARPAAAPTARTGASSSGGAPRLPSRRGRRHRARASASDHGRAPVQEEFSGPPRASHHGRG